MEKRSNKKPIWNLITIIVIFLLLYLVFHKDYRAILECIKGASIPALFFITGMGVIYQLLDAAACYSLIHAYLPNFRYQQAVEITFLGIFGNVSTLAAGTIPMQSYYLYRNGMQIGSGIGALILKYIFHKVMIFFYAVFMILIQGQWLRTTIPGITRYLYPGIALCAVIILALILICTWETIQRFVLRLIDKLPDTEKWRNRKETWSRNLEALYRESKKVLHNHACCRKVIGWNLLKLLVLYAIPYFCLRTLDFLNLSFGKTQVLSSVMFLITGVLPNVAGIGPAEFAFLLLFSLYAGRVKASSALVLYRIATYFFPYLLSIGVFFKVKKDVTGETRKV